MTWPELKRLFKKMDEYPPIDAIAFGMVKGYKPKPIGEAVGSFGIAPKKGKVKRRGDISR